MSSSSKDFKKEYYIWMLRKINKPKHFDVKEYGLLLNYLNSRPFTVKVERDQNRVEDAYAMREAFRDSDLWLAEEIPFELKNGDGLWPASVLEVLVAFASRIENDIMADEKKGDRTWLWFWEMMENLGLTKFKDETFENEHAQHLVELTVDDFLARTAGSIFKKPDEISLKKWKKAELWVQMSEVMRRRIEGE